jgi:hypothetical protein
VVIGSLAWLVMLSEWGVQKLVAESAKSDPSVGEIKGCEIWCRVLRLVKKRCCNRAKIFPRRLATFSESRQALAICRKVVAKPCSLMTFGSKGGRKQRKIL